MAWLKKDIVYKAFEENALAGFNFDIDADELQATCVTLDAMMGEWEGRGIQLGYPLADGPQASRLTDPTGLPAYAISPVYMNLAKRMASSNGKQLMPAQLQIADDGYKLLLNKAVQPQGNAYPNTMPYGAGNRRRGMYRPFFPTPDTSPLQNDANGNLDIVGD